MILPLLVACGLFSSDPGGSEVVADLSVSAPDVAPSEVSPIPVLSSARTTFVVPDPAEVSTMEDLLKGEAAKAAASGQAPFVQLYADWCGPCRELRAAMSDPLMQDAFEGTWIVLLDTEVWRLALVASGLTEDRVAVPAFFAVAPDGTVGAHIDGHAWGPNTPENMAPPLAAFFREHGARVAAKPATP